MNKEIYLEEDFKGFIQGLIDLHKLNETAEGISKLMLDRGYDALSEKQKKVFDNAIKQHYVDECKGCLCQIPFGEMLEALDNGGYCGACQHRMEKLK